MATVIFPHSDTLAQIIGHAVEKDEKVLFVHDQGLYLMCFGLKERDGKQAVCAYAVGCDPGKDRGWYDRARDLVGGDDFGEDLDDARVLAKMIEGGAGLRINVSETHLTVESAAR